MRASRIDAVMRQVQDIDAPTLGEATAGPGPGETRARAWPRAVRAAFLGLLLALGLAGFTGSSGWYEAVRDPLNRPETRSEDRNVFGRSRPIRSDEYAIELPVARAQQLARPAHPLVNVGIGLGELQRTPFSVPVLDWGLPFRPFTWPLLAGDAWSHGVRWFLRAALLALGLFAWLDVVTGTRGSAPSSRRSGIATVAALAVFFSSAVVWWLGHPNAQILAVCGLVAWAIRRQAEAATPLRRSAWALGVAWLAAAAFFSFYPPMWAPFLWVVAGTALDAHREARGTLRAGIAGAASSLAAVAGGVALSIVYHAPYLHLIADTVYPGRRVSDAGELSPRRLVELAWPSLHAYAPLDGAETYLGTALSNVCEASAVEVLPLFLIPALALVSRRVRSATSRAIRRHPGLLLAWSILAAWSFLPLPGPAGWATLLRWTPGPRAWFPFGVATALVVAAILAELAESPPEGPRLDARAALIAAATLGALLAWARLELPSGGRPSWWGIAMAAAFLVAAAAVVGTRWAGLALALAWLVPVAATNVQVNPLLRSRDLFHEEEAHALIRRALADRPGRILDFSTHSGSALAGHGWPVLAAVHMAPQESLWRFLAPATPGLGRQMWNRFAHVGFVPFPFAPRLPTVDSLTAQLDPCNPRLAAIGVNHVLTRPDMWLPPRCRDEYDVRAAGELLLWSRRKPVSAVGVARGERPTSALEFDWYGGAGARLSPERDRLVLEAPGGERVHYAFAFNLGLVDRISCQGAVATTLDTHVVVSPAGSGPARCEVRYLGTLGAMRRLLARGGNP